VSQPTVRMNTRSLLLAAAFLCATAHTGRAQPTIQFSASSYTVAESACFATITVQRLSDPSTTVGVDFATTDGTATNGLKYTAVSGTLAFGAGETNKTIVVPILDEGFVEGSKTFRVILSNPTVGAVLGARTNATVRITDNDVGIQFQLATYSVAEDAGAVLIGIVRGDDGMLPATVDFATADVTATNGLDYTGVTNTLSFAPGERFGLITVPILNDAIKEPTKNFRVTLSNPTGGAALGSRTTATVSIVDNDPGVGFELGSYSVWENAGTIAVTVLRGNDVALGPITVDYATSNLTATAGQVYQAVSGTLEVHQNEKDNA